MDIHMINKIINNRYMILQQLGKGGMGEVYLVADTLNRNKQLALKLLNQLVFSERRINNFKREFKIMTRLKHPNLLRVYNFDQARGKNDYFFTMEYIDGNNLAELQTGETPLSQDTLVQVMIGLCRAIAFIHARGILHRDIKPANVILTGEIIKIMDFGLADLVDKSHAKKGTLLYMAPEIIDDMVDYRCDIFSLGLTFFELITGTNFYDDKDFKFIKETISNEKLYNDYKAQQLEVLSDRRLIPLIDTMIAYRPDERFQNCYEIINALNKNLGTDFPNETDETRKAYVLGADFIGREHELSLLQEWLENEEIKIFVIYGESGIGKSRLMSEFQVYCQLNDIIFLEGNCYEFMLRMYSPFLPILNYCLLNAPDNLIVTYGPELKKILPDNHILQKIPVGIKHAPRIERRTIIEAVANFLVDYSITETREIVLFINDIQWSDETSIEVINTLIKKLSHHDNRGFLKNEIKLYFSSREEGVTRLSTNFAPEHLYKMKLHPFNVMQIEEYVKGVFGKDRIGKKLIAEIPNIHNKIGGNPLFLQELLKSFVENGRIFCGIYYWELMEPITNIQTLDKIEELIFLRLHDIQLTRDELRVLEILSLLNREIQFDELNLLLTIKAYIITKLEHIELIKLTKLENNSVILLSHDLIKKAVINNMSSRTKRELHELIARRLEVIHHHTVETYYEEIAHHYHLSENKPKAKIYLEKAAQAAMEKFTNKKALLLLEQCYGYLEEHEYTKKISVLLDKADIFRMLGKIDDVEKTVHLVLELCGPGDDGSRALAYLTLGRAYFVTINLDGVSECLQKSLALYKKIHDDNGVAHVLNYIAANYYYHNEYESAVKFHKDSIDIAKRIGDKKAVGFNLANMGTVYTTMGRYPEALQCLKEALVILKDIEAYNELANLHCFLGLTYSGMKQYDQALTSLNTSITMAGEMNLIDISGVALIAKAQILFHFREIEEAQALNNTGLKEVISVGEKNWIFKSKVLKAQIEDALGNEQKAVDILTRLFEEVNGELEQTTISFELWKITGDETYKQSALDMATKAYVRVPNIEYKNIIDELHQ